MSGRKRKTCLYFLEQQLSSVAFFAAAKRQMLTARCYSLPSACLSWPAMLNACYVCVRSLRLNLLVLRSDPIPSHPIPSHHPTARCRLPPFHPSLCVLITSHCSLPPFRRQPLPAPARSSRLNAWHGGTTSWRSKRDGRHAYSSLPLSSSVRSRQNLKTIDDDAEPLGSNQQESPMRGCPSLALADE